MAPSVEMVKLPSKISGNEAEKLVDMKKGTLHVCVGPPLVAGAVPFSQFELALKFPLPPGSERYNVIVLAASA